VSTVARDVEPLSDAIWRIIVIGGGIVAGLVILIVTRSPVLAVFAVPLGAIAAVLVARRGAAQVAGEASYLQWATARGWQPVRNLPAPLATPLLRFGDERRLDRGFAQTIAGCEGAVGHLACIPVERIQPDNGEEVERVRLPPANFTVVEVVTGLTDVIRFTMIPRSGWAAKLDVITAAMTTDRTVNLESADLRDHYRLMVSDHDSEIAVRTLFTPKVIGELLEHLPADGRVEFEMGALVVAVPGHHYDEATVDALLAVVATLTAAVTAVAAFGSAA
jgi:hypothetical protein